MPMPAQCDECRFCACEYTEDDKPDSCAYCCAAEKFIAKACDGTDKIVSAAVLQRQSWCPLKAHASVMTLHEAINALKNDTIIWVEIRLRGQSAAELAAGVRIDGAGYFTMTTDEVLNINDLDDSKNAGLYGKRLRFWTSMPSEDQRRAAQWDD